MIKVIFWIIAFTISILCMIILTMKLIKDLKNIRR